MKRSSPGLTLAVLSSAGLAYAVLSSAVVPALPTIQHNLHASETGVTWLLTGYLLSASVGTAILGQIFDRLGWRACVVGIAFAVGVAAALTQRLKTDVEYTAAMQAT